MICVISKLTTGAQIGTISFINTHEHNACMHVCTHTHTNTFDLTHLMKENKYSVPSTKALCGVVCPCKSCVKCHISMGEF